MTTDYRSTSCLPRTEFPMRAALAKREPEILARWREMGLYRRLRAAAKGRDMFILHDGPPMPTATCTWATRSTRSSRT